eukprot:10299206-Alexandrium_andersonii.AAC.1
MTRRAPAIAPQRISTDAPRGRTGARRPGTPAPLGCICATGGAPRGHPLLYLFGALAPSRAPSPTRQRGAARGRPDVPRPSWVPPPLGGTE